MLANWKAIEKGWLGQLEGLTAKQREKMKGRGTFAFRKEDLHNGQAPTESELAGTGVAKRDGRSFG